MHVMHTLTTLQYRVLISYFGGVKNCIAARAGSTRIAELKKRDPLFP